VQSTAFTVDTAADTSCVSVFAFLSRRALVSAVDVEERREAVYIMTYIMTHKYNIIVLPVG
jgi:hypothetical protein